MSDRDSEFIEALKDAYRRIFWKDLSDAKLANWLGVNVKTLATGPGGKRDFITIEMYQRLLDVFRSEEMKRYPGLQQIVWDHAPILRLMRLSESGIILTSDTSLIDQFFPGWLARGTALKHLKVLTPSNFQQPLIEAIESWAFGDAGNYADLIDVAVYEHDPADPFNEMVGMHYPSDDFYPFIKDSATGYEYASTAEANFLLSREQELLSQTPAWRLLTTPHARITERLKRDLNCSLLDDALAIIDAKINYFELVFGEYGAGESDLYAAVKKALETEFEKNLDQTTMKKIQHQLEFYKLSVV